MHFWRGKPLESKAIKHLTSCHSLTMPQLNAHLSICPSVCLKAWMCGDLKHNNSENRFSSGKNPDSGSCWELLGAACRLSLSTDFWRISPSSNSTNSKSPQLLGFSCSKLHGVVVMLTFQVHTTHIRHSIASHCNHTLPWKCQDAWDVTGLLALVFL